LTGENPFEALQSIDDINSTIPPLNPVNGKKMNAGLQWAILLRFSRFLEECLKAEAAPLSFLN